MFAVVLLAHGDVVRERKIAAHVMKGSVEIRSNHRELRARLREAGSVRDTAVEGIVERLDPLGPVCTGVIDGGVAFGVRVTVPYVILGPIPRETFETLDWPR
ncbi:hypothetical protein [Streptomyces sp. NPDC059009]|uniref:hypothetical protein n=1 Tax=Streptomyces sp. NPDC059009 TaxID=3346694 RepID=UPI0036C523B5